MLTVIICAVLALITLVYTTSSISKGVKRQRDSRMLVSELEILLGDLGELKVELTRTSRMDSDALTRLIAFFNRMSVWHDRQIGNFIRDLEMFDNKRFSKYIETLKELEMHFQNAGRNMYGWNRTRPNELVTDENVYLGGVWGLFTHPIRFWRTTKDSPKGGWGHHDPNGYFVRRNSYDVLCDEVNRFMESHTPKVVELIEDLERTRGIHRLAA